MVRKIIKPQNGEESIKFLSSIDEADQDEIIGYNELNDIIHKQQWKRMKTQIVYGYSKKSFGHQGPLKPDDKSYKG